MKHNRIVILALIALLLAACAGREAVAVQDAESELLEIVATGGAQYVLVVLHVEDAAQVENAVAVAGLGDGDQVEVWRGPDGVPEMVWQVTEK